ncbi:MAG: aldo/keto reductase [Anaerolineae bacterium]|nr:aldo/keto reductase [Anaerolineae bacterium]
MTTTNDRTLGRSNLQVSPLALGTVELGLDYGIAAPGHYGRPPEAEAIALVHATLDAGINFIDTARGYGESESVLGKALRGRRQQAIIATKTGVHHPDGTAMTGTALRQHMRDSLDTSLRLLQTDYVDVWQIHNTDHAVLDQHETLAAVFDEARRAGKIRATGGSFYGAQTPLRAIELDLFDVLQVTYSVFDQRLVEQVFPLATQKNLGVLVRSVLLRGALTERADHLPDRLESLRARSRQYRQMVAESGTGLTPAQAAIAFALAQPQISSVLIGIRSTAELAENLPALHAQLPNALIQQLATLRLDDEDLLNPGTWGA